MTDPGTYLRGSTEPWVVDVLVALVAAHRPHFLLETGTFEATTTMRLLDAMSTYAHIHGSFLLTLESDPERAEAASALMAIRQVPMMVGCEVRQADALEVLRSLPPDSVDFCFIDDNHEIPHVAQEIPEVQRILQPGGIACFHDVVGPYWLGTLVRQAGGVALNFPRLHMAGGLGILTK